MTAIEPVEINDDTRKETHLLQTEDISDDELNITSHSRASNQLEYMKLALDFKNPRNAYHAADILPDENANTFDVKQQPQQNVDRDELYETNSVSSTGMSALQIIRRSTHNNETSRQPPYPHSIGTTSRGTSPARSRNGSTKKHLIHDRPRSSSWANLQHAVDADRKKEAKHKRETKQKNRNRRSPTDRHPPSDDSGTADDGPRYAAPAGQSTFHGSDSDRRDGGDCDRWDRASNGVPSSHDIIEYSFAHRYHAGDTIDIYDVGGSHRRRKSDKSRRDGGVDVPRVRQSSSERKEEESPDFSTHPDDDAFVDGASRRRDDRARSSRYIGYKLTNVADRNISRRIVSFSTIQIRKYDQIIGDNPSCSRGPSVSLGWRYFPDDTVDTTVDLYEKRRAPRLDSFEMVMSRVERESLLLKLGYSKQDIAEGVRANIKVKNQRRRTVNNLPVAKMEEAVENFKRGVRTSLCRRMDATERFPVTVVMAVESERKGILKTSKSIDDLCERKG